MDKDTYLYLRGIAIIAVLMIPVGYFYYQGVKSQEPVSLSMAELKKQSVDLDYDELLRNTEDHMGEIVHYKGKVEQAKDNYALVIVSSSWTAWNYGNLVFLEIGKEDHIFKNGSEVKRLIDGDQIEFYATVQGRKTYNTVGGGSNTVPSLEYIYAKVK